MESSDLYYKEIRHCDLLTADSERKLFANYRTCSKCQYNYTEPASVACCPVCSTPRNFDARKRLVTGSVRYVAKVARDYLKHARGERHGEDLLLALVSAGNLGLLVAIDRFDLSRGTRFLTYAAWWVREKILEELDSMGSIRIPAYYQKAARARWRDGAAPNSDFPGVDIEPLDAAEHIPVGNDESGILDAHQGREYVRHVLSNSGLTLRERYLTTVLFGWREPPRTLRQASLRVGLSAEAVRDIRRRISTKTRDYMVDDCVTTVSDVF